jgi:2-methylcitrate dehydratase PrpD
MNMNITDKYIDSLYGLMQIDFSESCVHQVKKCLLDYLGVTIAGSRMLKEKSSKLLDHSESQDFGVPVIGFKRNTNLLSAALINGMSAHIAELDDGVRQGSLHPGAPIISALLPLVYQYKLSSVDLIRGIIIGYEASIRLASAIQPSHRNKGYHATGTCGTIGAAIGCAAALQLTKQQLKNALSAAATSASGMLNATKGVSELKPYNAGQAAVNGLMAAQIAKVGISGPDDILGGDWGLLSMLTDKCSYGKLELHLSEPLGVEKVYVKPFAACRHSHPAIEAALELRKLHSLEWSHIKNINISTYQLAVAGHDHIEIKGITSAKLSTPFSVAVALVKGKVGIDEFTDKTIVDKDILSLTSKVSVVVDEILNDLVPAKRPAIIEITTFDDKVYTKRVDIAKGEPEVPLSEDEIQEKFISLAMYGGVTQEKALQLSSSVLTIETGLGDLFENLHNI